MKVMFFPLKVKGLRALIFLCSQSDGTGRVRRSTGRTGQERSRDRWSFYFRVIRHQKKGMFARQGHIIGRKVRGEHFSGKEEVNSAWRCDRSGKEV